MAGGGRGDPMLQLLTEMAMLERGLKLRREQSNVGQGGGAQGWDAKDCSDNLEVLDDGAKVSVYGIRKYYSCNKLVITYLFCII